MRRARGRRGDDNVDIVEVRQDADIWVQRAELITDRFESIRNEDREERGAERAALVNSTLRVYRGRDSFFTKPPMDRFIRQDAPRDGGEVRAVFGDRP